MSKFPALSPDLLAQVQEASRFIRKRGLLPPELLAQAEDAARLIRESAHAHALIEGTRRYEEALELLGIPGCQDQKEPEQCELPKDAPEICKLRSRIHARVPPEEEQRMIETARRLLAYPHELIPSTDLEHIGLDPKTVWNIFKQPKRSGLAQGKRPLCYPRAETLAYWVNEYWPRGCPLSPDQTKRRSPQTKRAEPQTKGHHPQTRRPHEQISSDRGTM